METSYIFNENEYINTNKGIELDKKCMDTSCIFNGNKYLNIDNSVELDKSYIESFILSDHLTEEEKEKREKLLNLIHEYSLDVSKVLNLCFL